MTNAEKLVLKDAMAQKAVIEVLKLFNGASHKFALDVLKAAKFYLDVDSKFDVEKTIRSIETLAQNENMLPSKKK